MQAPDFDKAVKKIRRQVFNKFPSVPVEMKEDLIQEGVLALLESEASGSNSHWAVVRAISNYYWANMSVVRRVRSSKKVSKKKSKRSLEAADEKSAFVSDKEWSPNDKDIAESAFDIDDLLQDLGCRALRETLLVPTVQKTVNEREWVIIDARILSDQKKKTRPVLAKEMKISVERVRQLENQGLDRMKKTMASPSHPLHVLHP